SRFPLLHKIRQCHGFGSSRRDLFQQLAMNIEVAHRRCSPANLLQMTHHLFGADPQRFPRFALRRFANQVFQSSLQPTSARPRVVNGPNRRIFAALHQVRTQCASQPPDIQKVTVHAQFAPFAAS
ncbi:MAG: hypothetical protein ACLGP3_04820, partial [Acidobacteriota bacterium]